MFPPSLTVGRTVAAVLPDLADTVNQILDHVATSREAVREVELVGQTPAQPGATRQWMSGFYPVTDSNDNLLGVGVTALEITNLRTIEQRLRDTISTIQASFLPTALVQHPAFELVASYRPASADTDIGGDFYDTTLRPDGSINVTIGDVCGHDIHAAVLTSVVRYTISAASQHVTRPAEVLRWANQAVLEHVDAGRFVTVAHGTLTNGNGNTATLDLTLAGHPHPILLAVDGTVRPIGDAGTMLGIRPDPTLREATISLEPGDQIVLYTDGIAENSISRLDEQQLVDLFSTSRRTTARDTADQIMRQYDKLELRDNRDDVAIVVINHTSPARSRVWSREVFGSATTMA